MYSFEWYWYIFFLQSSALHWYQTKSSLLITHPLFEWKIRSDPEEKIFLFFPWLYLLFKRIWELFDLLHNWKKAPTTACPLFSWIIHRSFQMKLVINYMCSKKRNRKFCETFCSVIGFPSKYQTECNCNF